MVFMSSCPKYVDRMSVVGTKMSVCSTALVRTWGAIHQLLNIILELRILVLLPVSKLPYVVIVKNYSLIGE
jgi:hypothetical protein